LQETITKDANTNKDMQQQRGILLKQSAKVLTSSAKQSNEELQLLAPMHPVATSSPCIELLPCYTV